MKHAKEPWYVIPHPVWPRAKCRISNNPEDLWGNFGDICYVGEEDAKRIVACVNACAGIRTEVLEKGIIKHLLNEAFRKTINPFDYVEKRKQDMTYLGKPVYEEGFEEEQT